MIKFKDSLLGAFFLVLAVSITIIGYIITMLWSFLVTVFLVFTGLSFIYKVWKEHQDENTKDSGS